MQDTEYDDVLYKIEFTEKYIEKLTAIYDYIYFILKQIEAAKRLIYEINNKVLILSKLPRLYIKLMKKDKLKRNYHRIVVKNYIILYTIDYKSKKIYIADIIYGRTNYLI